jgi:hypothetical protein
MEERVESNNFRWNLLLPASIMYVLGSNPPLSFDGQGTLTRPEDDETPQSGSMMLRRRQAAAAKHVSHTGGE